MAQAVADIVGAIHCLPGTDRQGRGRQRLYDQTELPFAALVAALVMHKLPIGDLIIWSKAVRLELGGDIPFKRGKYKKAWHEAAFKGKVESYIILPSHAGSPAAGLAWLDLDDTLKELKLAGTAIVINVRETLSPFVR